MIVVGMGANLANRDGRTPLETCRWAVSRLDQLPGLRVRGLSRWFESAPIPPSAQPAFVNAIVHLRAESGQAPDPRVVLAWLMQIEQDAGRERSVANAARTLDLDLIDYDGLILDTPDLVLPHPRAHERAFVLCPLNDVAPDWIHPVLAARPATLIDALPPQALRILPA
ncbi:MAG: 2-amino-4-hydroxy-6-hydroxymethyldihydropteridine diphosphokinase [Rhodospirillales bacterium 69-11]|nr:2-amino-4-hydroxy-6-hydroxymethyldihydropteridine diphosphokinase [Rhodospirillales bacterium]MBN8926504.1 2-amino-4-hydroxy-6-hydroxymethyldihydropteridine diphosphokinase [Rhodospirillales bacterium]OJW27532.1 MAG: 2-amino-4-hydroxy-6-hydroxymethyldihydropteridine diphosphokinase [Rhodospirillales bacterium 69-11]